MSPVVTSLRRQITEASAALDAYQAECPHLKGEVVRTPRADTGNWDRGTDRYWYDCHCTYCDKHWEEPQ